jgi:hypothetical protein
MPRSNAPLACDIFLSMPVAPLGDRDGCRTIDRQAGLSAELRQPANQRRPFAQVAGDARQ